MRGATHDYEQKATEEAEFQSTLLMRGATALLVFERDAERVISIHAPHARSDAMQAERLVPTIFQSTLLMRGATGVIDLGDSGSMPFQSTLLMRGATQSPNETVQSFIISIHAPHARSDVIHKIILSLQWDFNPRSSCEERRGYYQLRHLLHYFNPRSSCEERRGLPAGG